MLAVLTEQLRWERTAAVEFFPELHKFSAIEFRPKEMYLLPNYLFYSHWIHPLMPRSCKSHIMLSLIKANSSGGVGGWTVRSRLCASARASPVSWLVCRKPSAGIFFLAPSGCCNSQTGKIKRRRSAQQYAVQRLPKKLDTYKHVG